MEGEGMMRKFLVLKSTSTGGSIGLDDVKDDALDFVKEKLAELLHFFQHIWAYPASKADEVFPPDTRAETFARLANVGFVDVLPIALALICLYCCRYSLCSCLRCLCRYPFNCLCRCLCSCLRSLCRRPFNCLRSLCCCFRQMMRAPGRGGPLMPRDVFESNPREYFINLRAEETHYQFLFSR